MTRSRYSLLAIVAAALLGVLATLAFNWRPQLGLDLQGGTSVVLEPAKKVSPEALDRTIGIIRGRVDSLGVAEPEISRQGDAIVVALAGVKDPEKAIKLVGQTAELRFRPVLAQLPSEKEQKRIDNAAKATPSTTVKPGSATTTTKAGTVTTKAATATTKVAAPANVPAAETTVAPASGDLSASAVGGARFGSFTAAGDAPVDTAPATTAAPASTTPASTTAASTTVSTKAAPSTAPTTKVGPTLAPAAPVATTPPNLQLPENFNTTPIEDNLADKSVVLPSRTRSEDSPRYVLGPAELFGGVVSNATASPGQLSGYQVDIEFNSKGSKQWDDMAKKYYCAPNVNQNNCTQVAVELDGVVLSAPLINAERFDGRAQITGNFSANEARELATALRYGSLPVTLKQQTVQTVSATLGRDSLRAGLLTGGLGILLVMAYMIFYYRRLGMVVVAGLMVSGALTWTLISLLGSKSGLALSLSGAVGLIVSVGITVDSYVVYFERMRDEMRAGKTMAASVDRAFRGAWRTILAADLTSLIGALTLYFLTVGSVRGFAFFLAFSTCLDMVVSYFFTRPLVAWLTERGTFGGGAVTRGGGGLLRPSASTAGGAS